MVAVLRTPAARDLCFPTHAASCTHTHTHTYKSMHAPRSAQNASTVFLSNLFATRSRTWGPGREGDRLAGLHAVMVQVAHAGVCVRAPAAVSGPY